jgi:fatty acid amide hydrolase 2
MIVKYFSKKGSDIGGSIRLPAFFNGIFGHKPTSGEYDANCTTPIHLIFSRSTFIGIVSNHEQQPVAGQVLQTYLVTGPMSRFCSDLLPMYRVLAADNVKKLKLDEKVPAGTQFPVKKYIFNTLLTL